MVIRDVNGSLVKSDGGGSAILIRKFGEKIKSRINGLQILNNHIYRTERNAINYNVQTDVKDPSLGEHALWIYGIKN